ncbi:regucalcin-like [Neocloeon triangulifer]|uniref:regucalcin-like n=1 Tax=Neocloeon triangulifer TaxID=2078957 RepID=UPI00286F50AA|nr:regucalcin-like [Neocloeon triangulifer]
MRTANVLVLLAVVLTCASATVISRGGRKIFGGRAVTVEAVTSPAVHAEGPHWQAPFLFYVDISSNSLQRLDTTSGNVTKWTIPPGDAAVTLAVPLEGAPGRILVTRGLELVEFDTESGQVVASFGFADQGKPGNRFNDGKADPAGRLWAGTMGPEDPGVGVTPGQGALYLLEQDGPSAKVSPVDISNGLAWNSAKSTMYYVDTGTGRVDAFDFNVTTAAIENRRTVIDFGAQNVSCTPDGMAIDAEDLLWVACWSGWKVLRVDPSQGQVVSEVSLPVQYTTSVAWGGDNLDDLYVSTSKRDLTPEQQQQQPDAGSVFRVSGLGVTGLPGQSVSRSNLVAKRNI